MNRSNADNILTYYIFASFLLLQEYNYVYKYKLFKLSKHTATKRRHVDGDVTK